MKKVCHKDDERLLDDLLAKHCLEPTTKVRSTAAIQQMKEIAGPAATRDWETLNGKLMKLKAEFSNAVRAKLFPRTLALPLRWPLAHRLSLSLFSLSFPLFSLCSSLRTRKKN